VRLAITHPYCWPEVRRGAERILVESARALAGRGHDVTVITSGAHPGRTRSEGFRTIRLRRLFDDALRHERSFAWRVMPYLLAGRYDVVHTMMPNDAVAAIRTRRLGGHRLVYEEIGIPWRWWWSQQLDAKVRERVVRDADTYACMSRFALDALKADWDRDGALIPGGVRLAQFAPEPRHPSPAILFSGALTEPRKGLAELLAAAALVHRDAPGLEVWLSGPGDPGPIIARAPAAVQGRVRVLPLGSPDEQGRRYARAWATALPSRSDCFGLVLVESLASGTPIVVLDDSAPPELVQDGNGAVAASSEPEDLAEALRRALRLAASPETAERCRASARAFDWDGAIAPRLEEIYARR